MKEEKKMFNATKLSTTQPRIYGRKKKQKNNNDTRPKKNRTKKRAYSLDVLALWLRDRQSQHVFVRIWFKCSNEPTNRPTIQRTIAFARSSFIALYIYFNLMLFFFLFLYACCYFILFFHLLLRSPSYFSPSSSLVSQWFCFFFLFIRCFWLLFFSLSLIFDINALAFRIKEYLRASFAFRIKSIHTTFKWHTRC